MHRLSSPSKTPTDPHQYMQKKRSYSVPIMEALGCSAPEAELMLAEGRAAVHSRRGRHQQSQNLEAPIFRPQDHLKYLEGSYTGYNESTYRNTLISKHIRVLSDATDKSNETVTESTVTPRTPMSPTSPLGDYSANLAQFIRSQLSSIPSYQPSSYPRSCPDLNASQPTSPTRLEKSHFVMTHKLEMPPVRPPLQSAFSAWSSADDDSPAGEVTSVGHAARSARNSRVRTSSVLQYYPLPQRFPLAVPAATHEFRGNASQCLHPNVDGFRFPPTSPVSPPTASTAPSSHILQEDYLSSPPLAYPLLASSSAPSISSVSTSSYFDCKRPPSSHVREDALGALPSKVRSVTTPYDGSALASVHDMLAGSQRRVHIDGMSFDLIRDLNLASGGPLEVTSAISTPC